jgi:hypothetical protein
MTSIAFFHELHHSLARLLHPYYDVTVLMELIKWYDISCATLYMYIYMFQTYYYYYYYYYPGKHE